MCRFKLNSKTYNTWFFVCCKCRWIQNLGGKRIGKKYKLKESSKKFKGRSIFGVSVPDLKDLIDEHLEKIGIWVKLENNEKSATFKNIFKTDID